jgi:hypothetical protein
MSHTTIADMIENGDARPFNASQQLTPRNGRFDPALINEEHALVLLGAKALIVKERNAGPFENRIQFLTLDAFHAWFSNQFTQIITPDTKIKTMTWSRAWLAHPNRRQYEGVEFFPNPDGAVGTPNYLNLWRGFSVEAAESGSYSVFKDHVFNNVCNGNPETFKFVWGWFAHLVQRPRERLGTAIVIRGGMGTGKTKVGEVFGSLISDHFFQVDDSRYVTGQFNAHMAKCLLLQAEEAVWAGDKQAEGRLKGLITSDYQMIEAKGIDPIKVKNYVRLLMTSNEDWVVPAGKEERRFCVLDINPRCTQNHEYFGEMQDELDKGGRSRLLLDLLAFDLSKVDLRRVPKTSALLEQKLRSLDPVESWWFGRLMEGVPAQGHAAWSERITVESIYKDYLRSAEETGVHRRRDPSTFGMALSRLVPGIEKTRPRLDTGEAGERRAYCYSLPPLEICRAAFEDGVGQAVEWPSSHDNGADDIVPD